MDFSHHSGACANVANEKLYLCSNDGAGDHNLCRVAISPTGDFEKISISIQYHRATRIAASEGKKYELYDQPFVLDGEIILALGSAPFGDTAAHNRGEILRTDKNTWSEVVRYPEASYIYHAPMTYVDGGFYVFGGYSKIKAIVRMDASKRTWRKVGNLITARYAHNVIYDGANFVVAGGSGTFETETCTLTLQSGNENIRCAPQNPVLSDYYYPELYRVPVDFCKDFLVRSFKPHENKLLILKF